jgi:hypothetical protein
MLMLSAFARASIVPLLFGGRLLFGGILLLLNCSLLLLAPLRCGACGTGGADSGSAGEVAGEVEFANMLPIES